MCNIAATTLNTCSCIDPPSRPPPASRPAIPSVSIAAESTPYSSASDTPGIVVCPERASDEVVEVVEVGVVSGEWRWWWWRWRWWRWEVG